MQQTILVLVSNPDQTSLLNLPQELKQLKEAIQRSQQRNRFKVELEFAATPTEVRRHLLDFKPQILHFCGHGTRQGLLLNDDQGKATLVSNAFWVSLLKDFASRIDCVLLNACDSEPLADELAQHLNYVIGMSQSVRDDAAIAFAEAFYDALGAGEPYPLAFEMGKTAVLGLADTRTAQSRKAEVDSPVQSSEPAIPVLKINPHPTPIQPPDSPLEPPEPRPYYRGSDPVPSLSHWQGRKAELADLQQWLIDASVAVVGIVGLGGMGKSTLAAKVLETSGTDHQLWIDLSRGTDFTDTARRTLVAWGMAPEQVQTIPDPTLLPVLLRQLQQQAGLLVLDNLESLLDETGEWQSPLYQQFVQQWIEVGTGSQLLLTSRERPPLEARRSRWCRLDQGLSPTEGAALLGDLGIRGEAADREAVSAQVGGYPLSLMLVAGLLLAEEELDPQVAYLNHYGDLFQIRGLHRGNPISIEAIFDWSFARLSPALQQVLTQVSVFRPAFNVAAAAALVPDLKISEADLRQLVRRSLLQELPQRDRTGQRRFQLQPQVQTLAQRRADQLTTAHQRAIAYYRTVTQPEPWQDLADVSAYLEIFHHCCALQQYAAAYEMLWYSRCSDFLSLRCYYLVETELYQPLVLQWQPTPAEQRSFGAMLTRLGNAYRSLGDYHRAIELYQQSLEIAKQIGERQGEAASLDNLGSAYTSLSAFNRAVEFHQQSLEIKRQIGDRRGEANSLGNLGLAYDSIGDYNRAIEFHQQSLEIAKQIGERQGEAASLGNLGRAYNCLGEYHRAIEFHQQSLEIDRQIGNRQGEAASLANLGATLEILDQPAAAQANYQQARDLYAAMGVEQWRQWCEDRLQQLEQNDRRNWMKRCVVWLWRKSQHLWARVRRWLSG